MQALDSRHPEARCLHEAGNRGAASPPELCTHISSKRGGPWVVAATQGWGWVGLMEECVGLGAPRGGVGGSTLQSGSGPWVVAATQG